ncbi:MAG: hypothetical protein R3174_08655, partial [Gammaproteobacteria bacterium]|nr:hypothetical protein [Gammaproteobacteria bacterium]
DIFRGLEPQVASLLRGLNAHRVPHSRQTLAEHLVGTHDLLRRWENPDTICVAGLFHSVYGTRVFEIACADFASRKMIRDVIGEAAESLAYQFCVADRDTFFDAARRTPHVIRDAVADRKVTVTRRTLCALLEIEAANIVEHISRRGRETRRQMRWYRDAFSECESFLSPAGASAVIEALDLHTADAAVTER